MSQRIEYGVILPKNKMFKFVMSQDLLKDILQEEDSHDEKPLEIPDSEEKFNELMQDCDKLIKTLKLINTWLKNNNYHDLIIQQDGGVWIVIIDYPVDDEDVLYEYDSWTWTFGCPSYNITCHRYNFFSPSVSMMMEMKKFLDLLQVEDQKLNIFVISTNCNKGQNRNYYH